MSTFRDMSKYFSANGLSLDSSSFYDGGPQTLFENSKPFVFNHFGEMKNTTANEGMFNYYQRQANECEAKARELHKQREAFILACIHCMNDNISTKFSEDEATKVYQEFSSHGFESSVVQEFIGHVKEDFFKDLIQAKGEDFIDDIVCTSLPIGYGMYSEKFSNDHFNVEFKKESTQRQFILSIPVKERSSFGSGNYTNPYRGRFLLSLKAPLNEVEVRYDDGALRFAMNRCVSAEFNPDCIAKDIKALLTSDALDKNDIRHYETFGPSRILEF